MKPKGSITVFFALIITAVASLILTSFTAVKIQAGRMMLANSADQALFSLFSEYDRDLAERYGLYFIDMGMDTGSLCPGECIDFIDDCAGRILDPSSALLPVMGKNILNIVPCETSIDAYRLLFEDKGSPAASQIVDYMKDTSALQLISALSGGLSQNSALTEEMEGTGSGVNMGAVKDAVEAAQNAAASNEGSDPAGEETAPAADPESISKTFRFIKDAGKIELWRHRSLLDIAAPDPGNISGRIFDISKAPSSRSHPESLGVISCKNDPDSIVNKMLIVEYMIGHTGNFISPSDETSLSYQLEYVISGRPCDRDSMSYVVNRLMLIRLGTNLTGIITDGSLKAEAASLATVISAVLALPKFEPVFEAAVIASWSWAESIADLRALLAGGKVPAVKNRSNWQISLENLSSVFDDASSGVSSGSSGLSYTDYMRIFLYAKSREETFPRFLDTAEDTIRKCCSRPAFRIDLCADEIGITLGADIEKIMTFYTSRKYSYCGDLTQGDL